MNSSKNEEKRKVYSRSKPEKLFSIMIGVASTRFFHARRSDKPNCTVKVRQRRKSTVESDSNPTFKSREWNIDAYAQDGKNTYIPVLDYAL